jgi:hypothetical protein
VIREVDFNELSKDDARAESIPTSKRQQGAVSSSDGVELFYLVKAKGPVKVLNVFPRRSYDSDDEQTKEQDSATLEKKK